MHFIVWNVIRRESEKKSARNSYLGCYCSLLRGNENHGLKVVLQKCCLSNYPIRTMWFLLLLLVVLLLLLFLWLDSVVFQMFGYENCCDHSLYWMMRRRRGRRRCRRCFNLIRLNVTLAQQTCCYKWNEDAFVFEIAHQSRNATHDFMCSL